MNLKLIRRADIKLRDPELAGRQKMNAEYLLNDINLDALLAPARIRAGLPPKADRYPDWESQHSGVAGSILGHYLSAVSALYDQTGDMRALQHIRYLVKEIDECARAHGDGYCHAVDKAVFEKLGRGEVKADNFTLNGIWVPFYSTHKLMAGLRDAAGLAKEPLALALEKGLADYLLTKLAALTREQIQTMLQCEHGCMSEVWCDLAADTGERKYLAAALRYFHHDADLNALYNREDKLDGRHANTVVTKVLGLTRLYEETGDEKFRRAADFFWHRWVDHRAYACGGVGDNECFFSEGEEEKHLTGRTVETCNSYNFLKLEEHLWLWQPSAAVIDFAERAILNHLAANIGRRGGEFGYFMALGSVGVKAFSEPLRAWWCCVGTGIENPQRYGDLAGAVDREARKLYCNYYWDADFRVAEFGLELNVFGGYPRSPRCTLSFKLSVPSDFTLCLRVPGWCREFSVMLNGKPVKYDKTADGYMRIKNTWQNNDQIELDFHTGVRLEPLRHHPDIVCFMYGSLLLAGMVPFDPAAPNPAGQRYVDHAKTQGKVEGPAPVLVAAADADPAETLTPLAAPAHFRSHNSIRPADLDFWPLMDVYEEHYAVYFRRFTPDEWQCEEKDIRRQEALSIERERRVVDRVDVGFNQSEADHALRYDESVSDVYFGKPCRFAYVNGYFSYELDCGGISPSELEMAVEFYSSEALDYAVDIYLNERLLSQERHLMTGDDRWFERVQPLPPGTIAVDGKIRLDIRQTGSYPTARVFRITLRRREQQ